MRRAHTGIDDDRSSVLEVDDVGELRRLAAEGADLPPDLPPPSLAASLELACTAWTWSASSDRHASTVERWCSRHDSLAEALLALRSSRSAANPDYGTYDREIRTVTDEVALSQFCDRFRKSLEANGGFDNKIARGLAGALGEMVDNVFEHSGPDRARPAVGVKAYAVEPGRFEFAVGDLGRGALASLRENPAWTQLLASDEAALDAIVLQQASSRPDAGPGEGFSATIRVLADFGRLRLRTGSAVVSVQTEGQWAPRIGVKGSCFPLVGMTVAASGEFRA